MKLEMKKEGPAGHPRFYNFLDDLATMHDLKNTDYASGNSYGPLGNFKRVSLYMGAFPEMNWATPAGVATIYMLKQLDAALMLMSQRRESVTGENVVSRMKDVAAYAGIIAVITEEEVSCRLKANTIGGASTSEAYAYQPPLWEGRCGAPIRDPHLSDEDIKTVKTGG